MFSIITAQIGKFLIFCSGAKASVLFKCPDERSKFMGFGATILFTGLLATLSGGYALYKVFNNNPYALFIAIPFALIWGFMIFNLDRLIVMSIRKNGKLWQELSIASGRIVLAIIIAVVISKPLEVKLFENRISTLIEKGQFQQDSIDFKRVNETYGLDELNNAINQTSLTLANQRNQLVNEEPPNPHYREIKEESLPQKEREFRSATNSYDNSRRRLLDIYRPYGAKTFSELPEEVIPQTVRHRNNMARQSRLKEKINQDIIELKKEMQSLRTEYTKQKSNIIDDQQAALAALKKRKAQLDSIANDILIVNGDANAQSYSDNLITQLEYLHKLTAYKKGNTVMFFIGTFITLLFLSLELSPILVKIFSKPGVYDKLLEAEEMLRVANGISAVNSMHQAKQIKDKQKHDVAIVAVKRWSTLEQRSINGRDITKQEAEDYVQDIGRLN